MLRRIAPGAVFLNDKGAPLAIDAAEKLAEVGAPLAHTPH
jgi:hypothetical protein